MSLLADEVYKLLREIFPYVKIEKEYYVSYNNQRLYVDFFIPSYLIAVEVHGRQHDKFVEYFHKDDKGWREHQRRDRLKEEWAYFNDITYVVIRELDFPIDSNKLLDLIAEAENG